MARDKYTGTHPRLLAVDRSRQLLPGTFEHALNHLLDHKVDPSDLMPVPERSLRARKPSCGEVQLQ